MLHGRLSCNTLQKRMVTGCSTFDPMDRCVILEYWICAEKNYSTFIFFWFLCTVLQVRRNKVIPLNTPHIGHILAIPETYVRHMNIIRSALSYISWMYVKGVEVQYYFATVLIEPAMLSTRQQTVCPYLPLHTDICIHWNVIHHVTYYSQWGWAWQGDTFKMH